MYQHCSRQELHIFRGPIFCGCEIGLCCCFFMHLLDFKSLAERFWIPNNYVSVIIWLVVCLFVFGVLLWKC